MPQLDLVSRSPFSGLPHRHSVMSSALALATVLTLAACAADGSTSDGAIPDNYPTIAPATVDGRYDVIEINGPTGPVALDDAVPPTVEVDVVTGELRIEPLCNRYLGSFTLDPDGTASFTVTGGTSETCPDPAIEQAVLDAFGAADRWTETDDGLELSGSASTMIRLRRS